MVSKAIDSSSNPKKSLEELIERGCGNLISKIKKLKEEIEADRIVQIKEKLDKSRKKLQSHIDEIISADLSSGKNISSAVPSLGIGGAQSILSGLLSSSTDKEFTTHEAIFLKNTKLPKVRKIPPYTTWIFLDRNQRMAEDQSVVGRRRIYYDPSGNEALICSDSEDDIAEVEEEKHEFSTGEDQILWMAFQEHGLNEDTVDVVNHFIGGNPIEIQDRYNELKLKFESTQEQGSTERNMFLEKSLSAALDSFDNLFCRRCLVFDCRLHGCSQTLVYPSEKPLSWLEPEDKKPCSDQCHLLGRQTTEKLVAGSDSGLVHQVEQNILEGEDRSSNSFSLQENVVNDVASAACLGSPAGEGSSVGILSAVTGVPLNDHANAGKRKISDDTDKEWGGVDGLNDSSDKKQKKITTVEPNITCDDIVPTITISSAEAGQSNFQTFDEIDARSRDRDSMEGLITSTSRDSSSHKISNSQTLDIVNDGVRDAGKRLELKQPAISFGAQKERLSSTCGWKPLEKDLYVKGLEIFGRNSCLIARNLLSGLKTCTEVSHYMHNNGPAVPYKLDTVCCSDDSGRADSDMEQEFSMRPRSRLFRKRGRTRRLKYSSKSNGHPSSWRRIGDGDQSCKQYTPCGCKFMCGKDCSCLSNGTCCEKYCGCSKSCKNRFRGCHCAKSQCRSRQCPCFAANRECDPDVCRNCWVSCGGGSLGEPPKRGDGQCGNMRLLLRQQQRILLGRSDVAGWGAFIKNTVNKHEYLGEYTGELISHREADKRGKIYDRANSSFLFDLNDQYVLDACRQGDKLKFANHSSKPNCYCKVMLVAGDHRVGIFAKERIEAEEELFYDYRYGPDQAPAWARKPEASKKDDSMPSQGRARKHQSH